MIEYAHAYVERGWRVLPLHTATPDGCSCRKGDCSSPGKHPRTRNGVKAASADPMDVDRWWKRLFPEANIGIACGEESGLVVLDMDPRNGGEESLAKVERERQLPDTLQVRTGGGGRHWYFEYPDRSVRKRVLARGLDLVSDGGYVVAPPSSHHSGGVYAWQVEGSDPSLARFPDFLRRRHVRDSGSGHGSHGFTLPDESELQNIGAGQRNVMLTRIAGAIRRWGLSDEAIEAALQIHNQEACNPPLPEEEVRRVASSISRYEPTVEVLNGEDQSEEGDSISIKGGPVASQ